MGKLIIDGNSVYEVEEECLRQKELQKKEIISIQRNEEDVKKSIS